MAFSVGILGMGRIGSGLDAPAGDDITTHLKAVLAEPRLRLSHVADASMERAQAEVERFGASAEVVTPDALLEQDLDVLAIATPDGTHGELALRATRARLVLVEKPLEGDAERRRSVVDAVEARGGVVVVDHLRRWIPGLGDWIEAARAGRFGAPLSVTAHYTRGFRHNGIHATDLVAAFLGPTVREARQTGAAIEDFCASDPTLTILAELETALGAVPALFVGVDGSALTTFDVDLRFQQARVVIEDEDGVNATLYRTGPVGAVGFADELKRSEVYRDQPQRLMAHVWSNVADHLESARPLACAGTQALAGYDLLDDLLERLP